ncbi:hypothetical protein [[Actinomadura] parvosata]|uniref:hypothetical protein n=1 Tax=[Actinomadura] parvosata TaxID=1955412 RepID=UPI0016473F6C
MDDLDRVGAAGRNSGSRTELLSSIGAALGLGGRYEASPLPRASGYLSPATMQEAPSDRGVEILAETIDRQDGHVGWVEQVAGSPAHGHIPVNITINVAGGGLPHLRVDLPTYNPFFGCNVKEMRFFDETLVIVYREKHHTIACSLDLPSGEQRLSTVGAQCVLAGALLCHLSWRGDRVDLLALPDLMPCLPLPVPPIDAGSSASIGADAGPDGSWLRWAEVGAAAEHDTGGATLLRERQVHRWFLPDEAQRGVHLDRVAVWTRLRELLTAFGLNHQEADILIGVAAVPLLYVPRFVAGTYARLLDHDTGSPPWWFPVAWYQHLLSSEGDGEAARWLAGLDRLSSGDAEDFAGWRAGWSREEGAAQLVLAHLRTHASRLASACRAGRLPADQHDWHNGWGHPLPIGAFPRGFRRAWNHLPARFRPGRRP